MWETVSRAVGDGSLAMALAEDDADMDPHVLLERLHQSDARVQFLTDGLPLAIVEVGPDGAITGWNLALSSLLGLSPEGMTASELIHPDDYERCVQRLTTDGFRDTVLEFRVRCADGSTRWVRAHSRVHVDAQGAFISSVSIWVDITEEMVAREASTRFGDVFESIEDLVALIDDDGYLIQLNLAGRWLLPDPEMELAGLTLAGLFSDESAAEINEVALSTARNFGSWKGEVNRISLSFERQVLSLSIVAHHDDQGNIAFLSAMTRDITDLKTAEENLRRQATTDALTGLPNRTILFDRLGQALARGARNGSGVALLFIDLDKFKAVNDGMGHEAGDELLVQVAHRLLDSVRGCDTVARIGGDEFIVLAEPISREEDARIVGDRIVHSMSQPFELRAGTATIGASIGLAMSTKESTPRALVKRADLAVYQAKAAGRSCLVVAEDEPV